MIVAPGDLIRYKHVQDPNLYLVVSVDVRRYAGSWVQTYVNAVCGDRIVTFHEELAIFALGWNVVQRPE